MYFHIRVVQTINYFSSFFIFFQCRIANKGEKQPSRKLGGTN